MSEEAWVSEERIQAWIEGDEIMKQEMASPGDLEDAAAIMNAAREEVLSLLRSRSNQVALAGFRRMIFGRLYDRGYSTTQIGWLFNKDHSTVVKAMGQIRVGFKSKEKLRAEKTDRSCDAAPSGVQTT